MHRFLFSQSAGSSRLDEIGNEGRLRIFDQYRTALNPLLHGVARRRRDLLVQVSFQIIASALLTKARGVNAGLNVLSWDAVAGNLARPPPAASPPRFVESRSRSRARALGDQP
jgi:hypothetical protein